MGCVKVNISTELKGTFSATLRKYLIEDQEETDPINYMTLAKNAMKEIAKQKILMCMSDNKG